MNTPQQSDELTLRYQEASAQDGRRPADKVREAVRAHALMLIDPNQHHAVAAVPPVPAANQSRWKISMLASVALAGLTGLLVLQFDHGTPQQKELALGRPLPSAATAPPAAREAPAPTAPRDQNTSADASLSARQPKPAAAAPTAAPSAKAARNQSDAPAGPAQRAARKAETEPTRPALAAAALPFPAPAPAAPAPAPAPATLQMAPSAKMAADATLEKSHNDPAQAPRQRAEGRIAQDPASALHEAARSGRLAELERLLALGAGLNTPDSAGRTPLILAVIHGHAEMVQRLLAAGANPALLDREGLTALQHARKLGLDRIAALIETGS